VSPKQRLAAKYIMVEENGISNLICEELRLYNVNFCLMKENKQHVNVPYNHIKIISSGI
jgi:sporulation protein YlmC with PRC-barrel domain